MRTIPDWAIQLAWAISGIFATGAVWYFLSLKQYDNTAYAAVGATVFAGIAIYLHRRKDKSDATLSPAEEFARRYTDQPSHIRFIKALPKLRRVVYENAPDEKGNTRRGLTVEDVLRMTPSAPGAASKVH
ncbi:hypothetical protein [Burkholderia cepacia]|uniref:hypothetical protein n=1 Tax=Burkholderia cepacia TaxID=292 RepID=UPI001CF28AE5|nr:hypothetical protein [Burkholderia cepacia]MCA8114959.1 hypothetical protein [Burkholderia cepacia]MCA8401410.1 hypothetical protein [Burkholderia cepacia]